MCKKQSVSNRPITSIYNAKMGEKEDSSTPAKVPDVNSRGTAFRQEVRLSKTLSLRKSEMNHFPNPSYTTCMMAVRTLRVEILLLSRVG